jgi:glycerol-3-phosphate O-acyltransferase
MQGEAATIAALLAVDPVGLGGVALRAPACAERDAWLALLRDLLRELNRDPSFDVTLVPVAVYWGRAPQREGASWLRLALAEDWTLGSRLRRFLTVLFNGRSTLVEFGQGVSLRALLGSDAAGNRAARRITRQLNIQFDAARAAHERHIGAPAAAVFAAASKGRCG